MRRYDSHIGDRELLLAADGELSDTRAAEIRDHLAGCPSCWMRNAALEQTLADVVQAHQRGIRRAAASDGKIAGALLRARLARTQEIYRPPALPRYPPAVGRRDGRADWRVKHVDRLARSTRSLRRRPSSHPMRRGLLGWCPGTLRGMRCARAGRDEPARCFRCGRPGGVRRYGIRNPRPRSYEVDG